MQFARQLNFAIVFIFVSFYPTLANYSDSILTNGRSVFFNDTLAFNWNGFSIQGRFFGSQLGIHFFDYNNDYQVEIDGKIQDYSLNGNTVHFWRPGSSVYSILADSLSIDSHTFTIYKRTEGGIGRLWGFDFGSNGYWLTPPPPNERRIEIIGDSYTAAYGNESETWYCQDSLRELSNSAKAYPVYLGKLAQAEIHTEAISGLGIVRNYGGSIVNGPMPTFFDQSLAFWGDYVWNFSTWKPQIFIISLGTNDFSIPLDSTQEQWATTTILIDSFTVAYHRFLDTIRQNYGGIPIILCDLNQNIPFLESVTRQIVDDENRAGYHNIYWLDFHNLNFNGCNYHPDTLDHQKIAQQFNRFIDSLHLWDVSPDKYRGQVLPDTTNKTQKWFFDGKYLVLDRSPNPWEINIWNNNGQWIYHGILNQAQWLVPTNLPPGVYYFQATSDSITQKGIINILQNNP